MADSSRPRRQHVRLLKGGDDRAARVSCDCGKPNGGDRGDRQ